MRRHYDFANMKGERNPYVKDLQQPITIRPDKSTLACFRALATGLGKRKQPPQAAPNCRRRDPR